MIIFRHKIFFIRGNQYDKQKQIFSQDPLFHDIHDGPTVWQSFPHRISHNLGFLEDNTSPFEFAVNRASAKKLLGIEFEVVNKTTSEFYAVESLEVSDPFIWGNYFTPAGSLERMGLLLEYIKSLQTDDNLNAEMTGIFEDLGIDIPDPNSVDNYDAIQILRESIAYLYKEGLIKQVKKLQSPLRTSSTSVFFPPEN